MPTKGPILLEAMALTSYCTQPKSPPVVGAPRMRPRNFIPWPGACKVCIEQKQGQYALSSPANRAPNSHFADQVADTE